MSDGATSSAIIQSMAEQIRDLQTKLGKAESLILDYQVRLMQNEIPIAHCLELAKSWEANDNETSGAIIMRECGRSIREALSSE